MMNNQNQNKADLDSIDVLRIFSQRRWMILFCLLVSIIGTYITTAFFIAPRYCAVSKVLVQKEKLNPENVLPSYEHDNIFIKNQAEIMASKPIIKSALISLQKTGVYENKEDFSYEDIESIQKNIAIDVLRNTSVIEMKLELEDKDLVAPLANAITAAYIESQNRNKKQIVQDALNALEKEVKNAKKQLETAEQLSEEYLVDNGIGLLPESEIVLSLRQFANFDLEVAKAVSELESVNTKLAELNKAIEKEGADELALPFLVNNPVIKGLKEKLRLVELVVADLLTNYTMDHPEVISKQMAIEQLKADLAEERRKIIKAEIESIEIERQRLQSKIEVLANEKEIQASNLKKVLSTQPKSARLLSFVKAKRKMVNDLLRQQGELKIYSQRIQVTPDIVVLEPAETPEKPISPSLFINLFLGALCGLTIGSAIAIMLPVCEKEENIYGQKKYEHITEKRSSPRFKTSNKITYTVIGEKDKQYTCWSKDIGRSGMKVISEEALKKDSILEFKIHRGKVKPIKGNGVVVWSSPVSEKAKGSGYVAGVKFYDVELDIKENQA